MNVLVTGCNGFIGSYVCQELISRGHFVIGTDIMPDCRRPQATSRYISADITRAEFVAEVKKSAPPIDGIIHCAAYISYQNSDLRLTNVNVCGTHNILNAAEQFMVNSIVFVSSVPVIGVPESLPITEEHPVRPLKVYHATKLMGEMLLDIAREDGVSVAHIRVPAPVGIGMNGNTIIPTFIKKCLANEPILLDGTGGRKQNYISASDIAAALISALELSCQGVFNIGNSLISNLDLAKLCKELTHSQSEILISGKPDPADHYTWDISVEKAERAFGFKPKISLEESILELEKAFRFDIK